MAAFTFVNCKAKYLHYEIGSVNSNSPVIVTTNFSLTYFTVESEVENSKVPTYISVVETEGLGVLNAYAGDKWSPEKIAKTLEEQKVKDKVNHNTIIIPGLVAVFWLVRRKQPEYPAFLRMSGRQVGKNNEER